MHKGTVRARRSTDTDIAIGHKIRVLRVAKQMSQSKLGDALGVTFQQIQKYENGVNRVGSGRLRAIADTLGVSVGELFEEPDTKGAIVVEMIDSLQVSRLVAAFNKMTGEQRTAFIKLAQAIGRDDEWT